MASKTVRVYEVLIDTDSEGPACDGTQVRRFRKESDAKTCADENTCYGRPATYSSTDAPRHVARRWGMC